MNEITIYLVGVGGYGEIYVNALLDECGRYPVRIVGATDPSPSVGARRLADAGVPFFDGMEAFYRNNSADLCIISTPIHFHRDQVICALEHGSNVLSEKPAAGSVSDVDAMIEASERAGKFAAVGFQLSYDDCILDLKRDILDGVWGKPIEFKSITMFPRPLVYFNARSWAGKRFAPDGRAIMDSIANNAAAHMLHNLLFCLGDEMGTAARAELTDVELYRANAIETFDAIAARFAAGDVPLYYYAAHPVGKVTPPSFAFEFENGVVGMGRDKRVIGTFSDGTVKDYGMESGHLSKLFKILDAMRTGDRSGITCTESTARTHAEAVEQIDSHIGGVHVFGEDELQTVKMKKEQDGLCVPGLADRFLRAYEADRLPGELD